MPPKRWTTSECLPATDWKHSAETGPDNTASASTSNGGSASSGPTPDPPTSRSWTTTEEVLPMTVMGSTSSVVVHDLDVGGSGVGPDEADPPLLVDADAVLSGPVSAECFQSVAGRHSEVVQRFGGIQHHQLPQGCSFDTWVDALDSLP